MKYIKSIFKVSILLLLLLLCVGSIYASDNDNQSLLSDAHDDGFDLIEDVDDNSDLEDENLDDSEDDDEDLDDEDFDDSEDDDEDLDDEDLDDYEDDDEDFDGDDYLYWDDEGYDFNESDYSYTDFDFLKFKITHYLHRYGNYTYHNWTESEEFSNEYMIYLSNPSNYTLNESSEGYKTYLKIFDSITSTFGKYNLTENETDYLKFMIIFFLNFYGNVSANYTWNESESFENFTVCICYMEKAFGGCLGDASYAEPIFDPVKSNDLMVQALNNSTDTNSTESGINTSPVYMQDSEDSPLAYIALVMVCVLMMFVII